MSSECCDDGHKSLSDSSHEIEIQRVESIGGSMVVGIAKICCIGEHDSWKPMLPERGVVAASRVRQQLAIARHDEWNDREV